MKNKIKILLLLAITAVMFAACSDDDDNEPLPTEPSVSYIVNYGSYSGDKTTITAFDKETGDVTYTYFEKVNGVPMVSNVQHALNHNGALVRIIPAGLFTSWAIILTRFSQWMQQHSSKMWMESPKELLNLVLPWPMAFIYMYRAGVAISGMMKTYRI